MLTAASQVASRHEYRSIQTGGLSLKPRAKMRQKAIQGWRKRED